MDDITASIIVSCQTSGAAASINKLGFSIGMLSKKVIQFGMEAVGEFQKTQDAAWKFGKTSFHGKRSFPSLPSLPGG